MDAANARRTKIKICGLKSVEAAEAVGKMNPDWVGFVFAESKRKVSPELAGAMIGALKSAGGGTLCAGVFVDPTLAQLETTLASAPLEIIQLHGAETPEYCATIKARFPGILLFKVISVNAEDDRDAASIRAKAGPYAPYIDALMLDTAGGGTGKTFAWETITAYAEYAAAAGLPLIVAGGLNPDNVADLVKSYSPDGVDVSSGVETDGEKDLNKIRAFIERVKSVDQQRT